MTGYDYIQFLTERLTKRLNTSTQSSKKEHEQQMELQTPFVSHAWFGMLPVAFKTFFKKQR